MISLKLSVENYDKMSNELKPQLTTTSIDLFNMINEYGKVHNIKIYLWFFSTCFCTNLFRPWLDSQILNEDKLNKGTIEKLVNDIFTLDEQENEQKVKKFAKENKIYRVWYSDFNSKFTY